MNLAFQAAALPEGSLWYRAVSTMSAPLKFIIRYNMGERQVMLVNQINATLLALVWLALMRVIAVFNKAYDFIDADSEFIAGRYDRYADKRVAADIGIHANGGAYALMIGFLVVSWIFFLIRHGEVEKRIRTGQRWHSQFIGDSIFWKLGSRLFFRSAPEPAGYRVFGEPLIVIAAGLGIGVTMSTPLGLYLMATGAALCVDYAGILARDRAQFLDAIDAAIMSAQLRKALVDEMPPRETEGYTVPPGLPMTNTREERSTLADIMERTDPRIRAMLDPLPITETEDAATSSL